MFLRRSWIIVAEFARAATRSCFPKPIGFYNGVAVRSKLNPQKREIRERNEFANCEWLSRIIKLVVYQRIALNWIRWGFWSHKTTSKDKDFRIPPTRLAALIWRSALFLRNQSRDPRTLSNIFADVFLPLNVDSQLRECFFCLAAHMASVCLLFHLRSTAAFGGSEKKIVLSASLKNHFSRAQNRDREM